MNISKIKSFIVENKNKILFVVSILFLVLISLSTLIILKINQKANTQINTSITMLENQDFNSTLNAFYNNRISGNEKEAKRYLGTSLKGGDYEELQRLEKKGWQFTNSKFRSFKVIYNNDPIQEDNFTYNFYLVRMFSADQAFQDEIVTIQSGGGVYYVNSINYNSQGYSVIDYQNKPYLVLKTLKSSVDSKKVLLANKKLEPYCTAYTGGECDLFIEFNGKIEPLIKINEIGQDSFFDWYNNSGSKIVYEIAFGEGGQAYDVIETLDLNTKKTEEIIRTDSTAGVGKDFASTKAIEISQNCQDRFADWQRLKRNGKVLEYLFCSHSTTKNERHILIYQGKVIRDQEVLKSSSLNFNPKLTENIYDEGSFKFKFLDIDYTLNLETGILSN